jgi:hypothetical protein
LTWIIKIALLLALTGCACTVEPAIEEPEEIWLYLHCPF